MFIRFVGAIITLVLVAAFLPVIMEVIGVAVAVIAGGAIALILLAIVLARIFRRRPDNIHIYHYR